MELEYHPRTEWHERSQPSEAFHQANPPSAFASSSTTIFQQRRRSSAAHTRPAGPPPNLPIPSLPGSSAAGVPQPQRHMSDPPENHPSLYSINGRGTRSSSFAQASSSISTAAAPQSMPTSYNPPLSSQSSVEDLSDPPPQSYLNSQPARSASRRQELSSSDRPLLLPPEHRSEHRPSSRRALTRALELAREAVQLDSTNDNPEAAVQAYAQSVALLSEVMERVRRGEDSTTDSHDSHRRRRRRSVAAQEEEVRRLQNIHDTYADRMNILSIIYSIPAVPYPTTSVYSTDSTASTSPTHSSSPSSDSSPQIPQTIYNQLDNSWVDSEKQQDHTQDPNVPEPGAVTLDESVLTGLTNLNISYSPHHPYATPSEPTTQPPFQPQPIIVSRTPPRRSRAPSTIPPAAPPPATAPPPAPALFAIESDIPSQSSRLQDGMTRQHASSMSHVHPISGLAVLEEETDVREFHQDNLNGEVEGRHIIPDTPRIVKHDPLPPLPSPTRTTGNSPDTPRINLSISNPPSPRTTNLPSARQRGASQLSTRPDTMTQTHIINLTTSQGTISQRRLTKTSAPPSRPASPSDSVVSSTSIQPPPKSATPSLSSSIPSGGTRSRSSSQPGHRPSIVNGRVSPLDHQRPPLPSSASINGTNIRKVSRPSPKVPVPTLPMNADVMSLSANSLIPVPSAVMGNLPTTPISPLPPIPPSDTLLKPYHMMNLLRNTMTSTTGGYVTRRLHVPCEVWSQGGVKLLNIVEKGRVVGILCSALEDLAIGSSEYFGAGNVSSGMALGIGSIGRKEADGWLAKLEEFTSICDGVVGSFGKKLGVGEGFVIKKTTWSDKLSRRFDKFTNAKNFDSPAAYVQSLKKLFQHAQLLDEHTRAILSQPIAPSYAAFPSDLRMSAEQKLRRCSEFFASVVLTFVIKDLSQLLDKYVKKCEKWLAE